MWFSPEGGGSVLCVSTICDMQPNSTHSFDTDKMASVFYTLVIPMLNPFIYSLRNKEVKSAFQMVLKNNCKLCI